MDKRCLIIGITGQDGSFMADLLLEKGYEVHGIIRRSSSFNTGRIDHIFDELNLHYGDITDPVSLQDIIRKVMPSEIYNFSAQSHVRISFEIPVYTSHVDAMGVLYLLEAVRTICPECKVYQASTSELWGGVPGTMPEKGYNEQCQFNPRSPYAVAKLYSYWICKMYRESYGMFVCSSILNNHESNRRGGNFVTKKITDWFNKNEELINFDQRDMIKPLTLGNLYAKRDWGYAKDFVEAIYLIMQQDTPKDYVVATGETHTVKEFVEECCSAMNYEIEWKGEGIDEVGYINGQPFVKVDSKYFRPLEVDVLLGDPSLIKGELGWEPKIKFKELVKIMLDGKDD